MTREEQQSSSELRGKHALVTGSGRGIGRQIALELSRRGASVIVNYTSNAEAAQEVVAAIKSFGQEAVAVKADVSKPPEIIQLFKTAIERFGKLDIVVSNSGIEHFAPIQNVTPEEFDRVFAVNTRGQFFVAQQAFNHLQSGGRLILLSSISAQLRGVAHHSVYAGSKCAVEAFARGLCKEFGAKGVTVNAIAPGGVKSDMYTHHARSYLPGSQNWSDEKVDDAIASLSPLNRVGYPEDVSPVVAFLCGPGAEWINGQIITIGGGAAMG
ncbi:ESC reductase [Xylona heveae TC161]|uniref:ESC reductase n=1 Tax=Xylona heveae (strain CBS 132557 / TC161) TaxID=1328760 RepID=A0A164ZXK6_XYLHT|nr:ESC reductase [Xylona heveae TC161]KZF19662.1 ESC reductase [Xylona heveae TC161]